MSKKFNLFELQKKGQARMNSKMTALIGAVVIVVLISAFAPTIFQNLTNATLFGDAPAWVSTVLPIIAGAGLVFLLWRTFQ